MALALRSCRSRWYSQAAQSAARLVAHHPRLSEGSATCINPNAAIGWKQPNGFDYPPSYQMLNVSFSNVELRHHVYLPQFLSGTLDNDQNRTLDLFCQVPLPIMAQRPTFGPPTSFCPAANASICATQVTRPWYSSNSYFCVTTRGESPTPFIPFETGGGCLGSCCSGQCWQVFSFSSFPSFLLPR